MDRQKARQEMELCAMTSYLDMHKLVSIVFPFPSLSPFYTQHSLTIGVSVAFFLPHANIHYSPLTLPALFTEQNIREYVLLLQGMKPTLILVQSIISLPTHPTSGRRAASDNIDIRVRTRAQHGQGMQGQGEAMGYC